MELYTHKIENIQKQQVDKMKSSLTRSEVDKANQYKNDYCKKISLVSRFLLRRLLSQYTGVMPEKLIINETKYGRPFLTYPKIKNFDFNVSHSGDYIVIAINKCGKVGVDIEQILSIDLSIAEQFCTKNELKYLYEARDDFALQRFYAIWTLKESFVKTIGVGLSQDSLKEFYFNFYESEKVKMFNNKVNNRWNFKIINFDKKYVLSVCSDNNNLSDKVSNITI